MSTDDIITELHSVADGLEQISIDCLQQDIMRRAAAEIDRLRLLAEQQYQLYVGASETVNRLRDGQHWIPVTERLPDKQGWYHIAIKSERGTRVEEDFYAIEMADSFGVERGFCKRGKGEITHWMAFPVPPEGEVR